MLGRSIDFRLELACILYNKRLVILIKHCHVEYGYTYYTPRPSCYPVNLQNFNSLIFIFQSESKTM